MSRQPIGGSPEVRRNNLAVVLGLLHRRGPMRRAELTDATGLNRSTVAGLVSELVALGAVSESAAGESTGGHLRAGRPSPVVEPCPDRHQVLAADVGVGRISMALVGLGGVTLRRVRHDCADPSPSAVADLLRALAQDLLDDEAARHVVAVGVAVPGVVRGDDGNVRFAPNLGWSDAPLGEMVAQRLPALRVTVGNDGDLGCLAEHTRGVAQGVDDVVFVEGEAGVGCGVVIAGRPLIGAGGYAGELGHMVVRPHGGRKCRCGASGCWETEIGSEAIAGALGLDPASSIEALIDELRRGGPERVERLLEVAFHLGSGLATVVNLLNPRMVVLGGLLREVYPLMHAQVEAALSAAALSAPAEQVQLCLPRLGGDAVLVGAAEIAWQHVLSDPLGTLSP